MGIRGVETDNSENCFLVEVPNRTTEILVSLIERHIAPAVISDCWKAYTRLEEHGYNHLSVNHNIEFKNPETGAHTNTVERM